VLPRLPARLRVLVGCAEVLQGGVAGCDFVDVDLEQPRVIMITCDDCDQPVPFVIEKLRVDLGRLKVLADRREPGVSPVYFKSRFLPLDWSGREEQLRVEKALAETGLFSGGAQEPQWDEVLRSLSNHSPIC
jgi:hypothetical protein